jgi:hypothetical protein
VRLLAQIGVLGTLAVLTQVFDLVTAVQMLVRHGPQLELNPLVRTMYVSLGPLGLGALKLVPLALIILLVRLGFRGRARMVRNMLVVAVVIGSVAAYSNLV